MRIWVFSLYAYRFGFNGKENDNEVKGKGNQQDYGFRIYDPRLGRFLSIDPLTREYPWYTPYQFAGNTPIQAIDLDGAEPLFFGWADVLITTDPKLTLPRPVVETMTETTPKLPRLTPKQLEAINRGNKSEIEQLTKAGLEKNTKPTKVELKDGQEVTTIPDAYKDSGKQTVEVKNVKYQSKTKQLQAQEKISNENGFKPELIINKEAKISKPVQQSFDISTYTAPPASASDNTSVAPPVKSEVVPK